MQGLISRGSNLLNDANRDAKAADKLRGDALASFEQAVAKARRDGIAKNLLADAVFGRSRALYGLKRYREAIADFKEAGQLGNSNAPNWLWWTTNGLAAQMSRQGQQEQGLLMMAVNHLDLTPELKRSLGVQNLKAHTDVWERIMDVYAKLLAAPGAAIVTDCDRLAAHPSDPYRVAPAVVFDSIDPPTAITACDEAIKAHPNEARYLYQRGRARSKAASLAASDKTRAEQNHAAAMHDFNAALERGYPVAFNNAAIAYRRGQGVPTDEVKAGDLYLETLNRIIHCCWMPVARHLLDQESQHDVTTVRRVVHELLLWAEALGSEPAEKMLTELYANAVLVRPTDRPPLGKADFQSLPPWLR